jgi:hypothetical protein
MPNAAQSHGVVGEVQEQNALKYFLPGNLSALAATFK